MEKTKGLVGIIVIFLLIFNFIPTNVNADSNFKLSIIPNVTEAQVGDQITYSVKMSSVQNLCGLKFKLKIPNGLTFIEGNVVEGLNTTLNAVKTEFIDATKVFIIGLCNYSSNTETTLMTFKCSVDSDASGNKKIEFIIDEDDIFDTEMNNIQVDYLNNGSIVTLGNVVYTTIETRKIENLDDRVIEFSEKTTLSSILTSDNFPVLNDNYSVKLYDANGNQKESTSKLGSKNVIKVLNNNEDVVAQYVIIVKGDITGNGEVKIYDAFNILVGTIFNSDVLDEIDILIRDFNNDGQVKIYDAFCFLMQAIN